jgi:hypothetical protein
MPTEREPGILPGYGGSSFAVGGAMLLAIGLPLLCFWLAFGFPS